MFSRVLLVALVLLAACGGLPRPFEGQPGSLGATLSQPPPARLAVLPSDKAYLADAPARTLADAIATGLLELEVPAAAMAPHVSDWRLITIVDVRAGAFVPIFRVLDPAGGEKGRIEGTPIPAAEWTAASPATLRRVASEATPKIGALLTRIEAARRQSDPNSLVNRAPRVIFAGVTGAPGDGNTALAATMKAEMTKSGQMLYEPPVKADFRVEGQVNVVPTGPTTQRVEIQWIVTDAKGDEAGRVLQLNEIRRGLLDAYWGDVALVVAQEAAPGVRDVITNRIGAKQAP